MKALWSETKKETLSDGTEIELCHVGSPEDPLRWEKIQAPFQKALAMAKARARKELVALGDDALHVALPGWEKQTIKDDNGERAPDMREAVKAWLDRDVEFLDAFGKLIRERCVAGIVGGAEKYKELHARGGMALVQEAAVKVLEFNTVSPATGEG